MSALLAIDPGTHQSGFVVLQAGRVIQAGAEMPNERVLQLLDEANPYSANLLPDHERAEMLAFADADDCAIEMIASYGMPVGAEVFETCVWIGRFVEAWRRRTGSLPGLVKRLEVKSHLCHSAKAKDGNVRQALIDRLGPPGTKKAPGATYGVSSHAWAALGVGVTYLDQLEARTSSPAKDRPNPSVPA